MIYTGIEYIFVNISFVMFFFVTLLNLINLFYKIDKIDHFSKNSMTIAFFCTTGFLITRYLQTRHLPLGNLYESLMFLSWGFSLLYLILEVRDQIGLSHAVLAPGAMLIHAFATLSLPQQMRSPTLLVPALQSQWLMMHVSAMLISYITLLCGSLLAITLLSLFYGKVGSVTLEHKFEKQSFFFLMNPRKNLWKQTGAENYSYFLISNSRKCQLINCLDKWACQTISLGFSLLTIGILSGAVWANEAWGSYWSWDPKETWALVTWLVYAIYLHTKVDKRKMGEGPAMTASMGFFLVWICFLGVNLLGVGLHNYGWLA
uniref:Cytochrome c biogenesis protein CcsA n=1 Tax=Adiantum capillus-veneris TaxID=13818 RepID=CCSA_ADICA|nr:cytochrome c biogenesis protein [Adiantum capillus-veneris]Q85FH6.2 RecName: Full=Cytochrome c biogenesis protein CcsA [Adiantum capillus-veneris]AAP29440.2 cytochrome c biogenesis protein [Adiantum capillus-veneris]